MINPERITTSLFERKSIRHHSEPSSNQRRIFLGDALDMDFLLNPRLQRIIGPLVKKRARQQVLHVSVGSGGMVPGKIFTDRGGADASSNGDLGRPLLFLTVLIRVFEAFFLRELGSWPRWTSGCL